MFCNSLALFSGYAGITIPGPPVSKDEARPAPNPR
jgi:hypothetical protein